jgi:hypothetical protein
VDGDLIFSMLEADDFPRTARIIAEVRRRAGLDRE